MLRASLALASTSAIGTNLTSTSFLLLRRFSADVQVAAPLIDNVAAAPAETAPKQDPPTPSTSYRPPLGSSLQRYGRDLTDMAEKGLLDPLIGRRDVVERALQILLRRTKNNPVLIGDPGTGKTAIAEGIAQAAASPAAPPALRGRSIVALDIGALVAGTQYRGAFEERLQGIINDIRMASGRVILFIDEIHMLTAAGKVEGGMNAANLLKPALARGELRCIGATTVEEYRKHVESDAAFARRLQPVMVEEPTAEEATAMLQGLLVRYSQYHHVRFSEEAVPTAVAMAQRFVSDRRLPDSAIDILDEAASRAQLRGAAGEALAAHLVETARLVGSLEQLDQPQQQQTEENVLDWRVSGSDGRSPEEIRRLLEWFGAGADAEQQQQHLDGDQGSSLGPASYLEREQARRRTTEARKRVYLEQFGQGTFTPSSRGGAATAMNSDGGIAEMAATGKLPCPHCGTPTPSVPGAITVSCPNCRFVFLNLPPEKLMMGASLFLKPKVATVIAAAAGQQEGADSNNMNEFKQDVSGSSDGDSSAHAMHAMPVVGALEVMEVVAATAGIPLDQVLSVQSSWQTLQRLEESLLHDVVGQHAAVHAVAAAIRLGSALGYQHKRRRPLASLLLTGPVGVGKRTLCRALAASLFGSDRNLLRFDLAQSTDKTAVSRLVGAPPGYVGYGEGGALTEAVRRRPHSVVVFENAHLAHPDVLTLLGQILNDGELQDSMGKKADFRNSVVVLTSPLLQQQNVQSDSAVEAPQQQQQQQQPEIASVLQHSHGIQSSIDPGDGGTAGRAAHRLQSPQQSSNALALPHEDDETRSAGKQHRGSLGSRKVDIAPEILASLDCIVPFKELELTDLKAVASKLVDEAAAALFEQGIELEISDEALAAAARAAGSSSSGAASLGATVRSMILAPAVDAAMQRIAGEPVGEASFGSGRGPHWVAAVDFDLKKNEFTVNVRKPDI